MFDCVFQDKVVNSNRRLNFTQAFRLSCSDLATNPWKRSMNVEPKARRINEAGFLNIRALLLSHTLPCSTICSSSVYFLFGMGTGVTLPTE